MYRCFRQFNKYSNHIRLGHTSLTLISSSLPEFMHFREEYLRKYHKHTKQTIEKVASEIENESTFDVANHDCQTLVFYRLYSEKTKNRVINLLSVPARPSSDDDSTPTATLLGLHALLLSALSCVFLPSPQHTLIYPHIPTKDSSHVPFVFLPPDEISSYFCHRHRESRSAMAHACVFYTLHPLAVLLDRLRECHYPFDEYYTYWPLQVVKHARCGDSAPLPYSIQLPSSETSPEQPPSDVEASRSLTSKETTQTAPPPPRRGLALALLHRYVSPTLLAACEGWEEDVTRAREWLRDVGGEHPEINYPEADDGPSGRGRAVRGDNDGGQGEGGVCCRACTVFAALRCFDTPCGPDTSTAARSPLQGDTDAVQNGKDAVQPSECIDVPLGEGSISASVEWAARMRVWLESAVQHFTSGSCSGGDVDEACARGCDEETSYSSRQRFVEDFCDTLVYLCVESMLQQPARVMLLTSSLVDILRSSLLSTQKGTTGVPPDSLISLRECCVQMCALVCLFSSKNHHTEPIFRNLGSMLATIDQCMRSCAADKTRLTQYNAAGGDPRAMSALDVVMSRVATIVDAAVMAGVRPQPAPTLSDEPDALAPQLDGIAHVSAPLSCVEAVVKSYKSAMPPKYVADVATPIPISDSSHFEGLSTAFLPLLHAALNRITSTWPVTNPVQAQDINVCLRAISDDSVSPVSCFLDYSARALGVYGDQWQLEVLRRLARDASASLSVWLLRWPALAQYAQAMQRCCSPMEGAGDGDSHHHAISTDDDALQSCLDLIENREFFTALLHAPTARNTQRNIPHPASQTDQQPDHALNVSIHGVLSSNQPRVLVRLCQLDSALIASVMAAVAKHTLRFAEEAISRSQQTQLVPVEREEQVNSAASGAAPLPPSQTSVSCGKSAPPVARSAETVRAAVSALMAAVLGCVADGVDMAAAALVKAVQTCSCNIVCDARARSGSYESADEPQEPRKRISTDCGSASILGVEYLCAVLLLALAVDMRVREVCVRTWWLARDRTHGNASGAKVIDGDIARTGDGATVPEGEDVVAAEDAGTAWERVKVEVEGRGLVSFDFIDDAASGEEECLSLSNVDTDTRGIDVWVVDSPVFGRSLMLTARVAMLIRELLNLPSSDGEDAGGCPSAVRNKITDKLATPQRCGEVIEQHFARATALTSAQKITDTTRPDEKRNADPRMDALTRLERMLVPHGLAPLHAADHSVSAGACERMSVGVCVIGGAERGEWVRLALDMLDSKVSAEEWVWGADEEDEDEEDEEDEEWDEEGDEDGWADDGEGDEHCVGEWVEDVDGE